MEHMERSLVKAVPASAAGNNMCPHSPVASRQSPVALETVAETEAQTGTGIVSLASVAIGIGPGPNTGPEPGGPRSSGPRNAHR